jgi:ribosome-interacting GTPase 1
MPANLNPPYFEVEKRFKEATDPAEKAEIIEEILAIIPKHKGTEKLQAMWKTKMAKLKNSAQKKSGTARYAGHKVHKSGAGQVVIIGAPNSGKSQLIKTLTQADLIVSSNPYTTHEASPVMMPFENIKIQMVDTPPITPEFMEDWYPDLIKGADASILILDLGADKALDTMLAILEKLETKKIHFNDWFKPFPTQLERGWSYKKTLVVGCKSDLLPDHELLELYEEELKPRFKLITTSAETGNGIETLRQEIFNMLEIIRVYSKIPGKKAEKNDPFTLSIGSNVMDMAKAVHKDFAEQLQFARIWGKNAYDGQRVNRNHALEDEDLIELHM